MQASFFVQIKPEYGRYYDKDKVTGIRATKMTQKRPENVDGFVVKVTLDVPDDHFEIPSIKVHMPSHELEAAIAETKNWTV